MTRSEALKEFGADDIVIVVAPVYGGHFAPVARKRMLGIKGNGARAVLVAVYGNRMFEQSLSDMELFAREQGFVPVAFGAFVGEHSYSSQATPIAVGRPDKEDIDMAHAFGKAVAEKISCGDSSCPDVSQITDEPVSRESLENFIAFVRSYQTQQAEAPQTYLPVTDSDLCLSCGVCADVCPTQAIDRSEGFPTDHFFMHQMLRLRQSLQRGRPFFPFTFRPGSLGQFLQEKSTPLGLINFLFIC